MRKYELRVTARNNYRQKKKTRYHQHLMFWILARGVSKIGITFTLVTLLEQYLSLAAEPGMEVVAGFENF